MKQAPTNGKSLVSVIIPAFNYGEYISETILSVQSQTYSDWECLIVDDGSTDDTARAVAKFTRADSRVRYIYQKNQGLAATRNNAIKAARGDYIQFLDADDLLEKRKLEAHAAYLDENPKVDICYGDSFYFPNDEPAERWFCLTEKGSRWLPEIQSGEDAVKTFVRINIPVNAPLARKSAVDKIGLFDVNLECFADWDFWFRAAAAGCKFQFVNSADTAALIRSHKTSMSQARTIRNLDEAYRTRRKMAVSIKNESDKRLNDDLAMESAGNCGIEEIIEKKYLSAAGHFCKAALAANDLRAKLKWTLGIFITPLLTEEKLREFPHTPLAELFKLNSAR